MRVLHIANFGYKDHGGSFYNTDRKISAGFVRNGHFVYEFSLRDMARMSNIFRTKSLGISWAKAEVLRLCEQMEPELVLLGHAQILPSETLREIKARWPATKIALWYVDPLFHEDKTQYMKAFAPYLDAVFVTTGGEYLQNLVSGVTRAYFPNVAEQSVENLENFKRREFRNEFIFYGTVGDDISRKHFLEDVRGGLSDLSLGFYGLFDGPNINGMSFMRALGDARMGLNYSRRNDVSLYTSDRLAQLTGHGLLTLSPRVPELDLIYKQDELAYFDTSAELIDLVHFYASHPEEAAKIAEAGWKRAHTSCSSERVARFMEETTFEKPYSEAYEWQDHIFRA